MKLRCPEHLTFIRSLPCCIRGKEDHVCGGMPEAMHVRGSKDAGVGQKPGDQWTIPGCSIAHREQHAMGERAFQAKYGIDMIGIAELLWAISPEKHKATFFRKPRRKAKAKAAKRKLTHPTLKKKVSGEVVRRAA